MPRFTVHIRDEWLAVPCRDTKNTIQWLGYEALKRYIKNKPDNGGIKAVKDTRFVVRRCQSLGLLDADDTIEDVLEDNDFVELGNVNQIFTLTSELFDSCTFYLSPQPSRVTVCHRTLFHVSLEFHLCILGRGSNLYINKYLEWPNK